ncbi:MAG: hypothetical protein IJV24_07380 [Prevotella sp.]|nr:hypothetical protein [Prevotella sp.]
MKQLTVVLTIALLAVMMMAVTGCSKEDSEDNMEQKQALVKDKIVGVWRNGVYWVSFSESGYASAFLELDGNEIINEGDYRLSGDTIITKSSPWWHETPYTVNHVTDTKISMTVEYFTPGWHDLPIRKGTVVLKRCQDTPCERHDGLAGKIFYAIMYSNTFEKEKYKFDDNEYKTINGTTPYVFFPPFLYTPGKIGKLSDLDRDTVTYELISPNSLEPSSL